MPVLTFAPPAIWVTNPYTDGDAQPVPAVTALSHGALYTSDANGHRTCRMPGGHIDTQTDAAENRLVSGLTQGRRGRRTSTTATARWSKSSTRMARPRC